MEFQKNYGKWIVILKNIMAPDGPLIFIIFIFSLNQFNRLNWTQFIAVNYTDEPAVSPEYTGSVNKVLKYTFKMSLQMLHSRYIHDHFSG